MPRAKENTYIFVSPGFVWLLQACRVGALLRERDRAEAVRGRRREGSVEKVGDRKVGAGDEGRETHSWKVPFLQHLLQAPSPPFPSAPRPFRAQLKAGAFRPVGDRSAAWFSCAVSPLF